MPVGDAVTLDGLRKYADMRGISIKPSYVLYQKRHRWWARHIDTDSRLAVRTLTSRQGTVFTVRLFNGAILQREPVDGSAIVGLSQDAKFFRVEESP